jgi:hypothetical protein
MLGPMTTVEPLNWGRVVRQALAAGVAAGVALEAYLYLTVMLPSHTTLFAAWQLIASAAIGKAAFDSPSYAWLGLVLHFGVSIGWAGGYAYFAQHQPFVNRRWVVSGICYGLVVYLFMQILLLGARAPVFPPTPTAWLNDLFAHAIFFGLPLAFVVARMDRT